MDLKIKKKILMKEEGFHISILLALWLRSHGGSYS